MTASWIDELNGDPESLPPIEEKFDPEHGDLVKEVKEYLKEKRVVATQVAERKKWKKFGASKLIHQEVV
ncbi:unnamed protein product [Heterobilharzia americana]|nr:unnamed protein product [Heterobilharzia americana]